MTNTNLYETIVELINELNSTAYKGLIDRAVGSTKSYIPLDAIGDLRLHIFEMAGIYPGDFMFGLSYIGNGNSDTFRVSKKDIDMYGEKQIAKYNKEFIHCAKKVLIPDNGLWGDDNNSIII